MPGYINAQLRHSKYYKDQLGISEDQYLSGGDSTLEGLKLFDYEWENIRRGHEWAVENIALNKESAELCNSYSDVGAFCLDFRLNPNELIHWHEIGVEAAKRLKDRVSESIHYGNLGLAYFAIGEFDKAFECYQQQGLLSQESNSRDIEAIATGNLGSLYCELGEYEKSIEHLNKSLNFFKTQKDYQYQATLLGNLGNVYLDLGSTYEPLSNFDNLNSKLDNKVALTKVLATHILLEPKQVDQGRIEDAIINYKRCLEFAKEVGDYRNEGSALGNLGFAYYLLGDIDSSLEYLNQGLSILSPMSFKKGQIVLFGIIGLAFKKSNNLDAALDAHMKQLSIARDLESQDAGVALFHLGETYYRLGDQGLAFDYFNQGARFIQGRQLKFPKIQFNLIASSKRRHVAELHPKPIGWLLEQTKKYFVNAGFELHSDIATETGFAISTSQWSSHKQYGKIFVQVFSGDLTGDNLIDLRETSRQNEVKSIISYAVYEDSVADSAFYQMGAFRLGINLTIVPLELHMIIESLSMPRDDIYRNLCRIEQKYLSHSNPYGQSNAIVDPALFFGRQRETDAIIKKLKIVEHVGVFGIRKIGKTSFLNNLKHRLNIEKIPVAFIGLEIEQPSPLRLFETIILQFRDYLNSLGINNLPQSKLLIVTPEKKADQIFREEILELSKLLQKRTGNSLMVIMVDEVERLVPTSPMNSSAYMKFDGFFTPIRDLSQYNRCLVSVVSGERATIREEFPFGYSNTMFELYQPTYLSFFDYEECSDMVVKLGKLSRLEYTKESLNSIFEETAGHPYISQMLCWCLADNLNDSKVSSQHVEMAVQPTLDILNEYFKAWWQRITEAEQAVLKTILSGNNIVSSNYHKHQESLRTLILNGIVAQSHENYYIAPHLLNRWLLQRGLGEHE